MSDAEHQAPVVVRFAGKEELRQMSASFDNIEAWEILEGYLQDPKMRLLQVIIPIPTELLDDPGYAVADEVFEEVKDAIPTAIKNHLEYTTNPSGEPGYTG